MTSRFFGIAVVGLITLALTACPRLPGGTDGGDDEFDAGNPDPRPACSGGCADNQVCDTARRTCVTGCRGGCDGGSCVKSGASFACVPPVTSCGDHMCESGQVACLGGQCSCLAAANSSSDTCAPQGKWCNGGACTSPKSLEQCLVGGPACPVGYACTDLFGPDRPVCTKQCTAVAQCNVGEFCFRQGCLPSSLTSGQECSQQAFLADGGFDIGTDGGIRRITVPAGNTCLLKDESGNISNDQGKGAGNCSYTFLKFVEDGILPIATCKPPGSANEGEACKLDQSRNAKATQCGTGLHCIATKSADEGVCLRMCNANPPKFGITPEPACKADETCVNQFRYTDPSDNAVLGVCMKSCNVFDPMKSTCAKVGTTNTSCVPTTGNGSLLVTTTGAGLCVPQQATVAVAGANCNEVDPLRGAACGSGQVCTSRTLDARATCVQACDVRCSPNDGGTGPSRCDTEPNGRCASGTCKQISSTSGAIVGFCQ